VNGKRAPVVTYCRFPETCALCWWRRVGPRTFPLTAQQWRSILGPHPRQEEEDPEAVTGL